MNQLFFSHKKSLRAQEIFCKIFILTNKILKRAFFANFNYNNLPN